LPVRVTEEQKTGFFLQNALDLYQPQPV